MKNVELIYFNNNYDEYRMPDFEEKLKRQGKKILKKDVISKGLETQAIFYCI